MATIEEIEKELNSNKVKFRKTSLVDKLAAKGYKFRDVANMPKSKFTKKRKKYKKKRK